MLFAKILLAIGCFLGAISFPLYLLIPRLRPKDGETSFEIGVVIFLLALIAMGILMSLAGIDLSLE